MTKALEVGSDPVHEDPDIHGIAAEHLAQLVLLTLDRFEHPHGQLCTASGQSEKLVHLLLPENLRAVGYIIGENSLYLLGLKYDTHFGLLLSI
jgi:hypothetical protein